MGRDDSSFDSTVPATTNQTSDVHLVHPQH
jgi:hypothetical protein